MKIAIPLETADFEHRVAAFPETVKKFIALKEIVCVEKSAGQKSDIRDDDYQNAGALIGEDFEKTVKDADLILKINAPDEKELSCMKKGAVLIAQINALTDKETVNRIARAGLTCFALELIPRISRAQSMDILSSQMNLAGYKAVIDSVAVYKRVMPLMMTAAGTLPAARVLVLGAGVAGLQAIATAKRLGAVVYAFDVRAAVKEQVESLGAKFVVVDENADADAGTGYAKETSDEYKKKQAEAIAAQIKKADIVITTALIPGKKAPVLVSAEMVKSMRAGSVIFDLATKSGGNVEGSVYNETVEKDGITILGYADEPSRLAADASFLFAKNVFNFASLLIDKETGNYNPDFDDEILKGCCIVKDGVIVHPLLKE